MPVPSDTIVTARLDLVPLRVADADEMVGVLADPALYAVIGGRPPSLVELVERYRLQAGGRSPDGREAWHNWIVRIRPQGTAIGFVQATVDEADRSAEVAWLIGVPWQGHGFASEAARELVAWLGHVGVRSIVAHVHPDHHASAAVAARAGLAPTDELVDGERAWRRTAAPDADAAADAEQAEP